MLQLLKPVHLRPVTFNKRSHHSEKPVHLNKKQPQLAASRESPHTSTKTKRNQKEKVLISSQGGVTKTRLTHFPETTLKNQMK